eukprot:971030-Amphidinium_carterae.1
MISRPSSFDADARGMTIASMPSQHRPQQAMPGIAVRPKAPPKQGSQNQAGWTLAEATLQQA